MSSSKNLEFEKTSFLNKSNSAFIEQMYLKFINKDSDLPESWLNYFEGIGEELNVIAKEINGPSWGPQKNKVNIINTYKRSLIENFIVESDLSNEEVNVFISMSKTSMDALKSIISQFHNKYRVVFIVPSERFIEENSGDGIYKYCVWDQATSLDGLKVILRDIK